MTAPRPTILLTGANGGLGSAFVTAFLKSPQAATHHGLYTVRNPSTAHELQSILKSAPFTHTYDIFPLDLSSLESVRSLAEDINSKIAKGELGPIRALVLNAALQDANAETLKPRTFTKEGYEAHFGINYLANFLLTLLLLQSLDKKSERIVLVSSYTHDGLDEQNDGLAYYKSDTGEFRELYKGTEELARGKEWSDDGWKAGMRRYGASKACLVLFMYELQRRLSTDATLSNISVLALDPGGMAGTNLSRNGPPLIKFLTGLFGVILQEIMVWFSPNGQLRPPRKSAGDLLAACFADTWGEHPRGVYLNGSVRKESSVESRDLGKQKMLWGDSLTLARVREGETVLRGWE